LTAGTDGTAIRSLYRHFYWSVLHPLREDWTLYARTRSYPGGRRLIKTVQPYTMVGLPRLLNALDLAHAVEKEEMRGALVECGVFKGGCVGMMARIASDGAAKRKVWLFDSFEGLPEPTDLDGEKATAYADDHARGELRPIDRCVGLLGDVERLLFETLRVPREVIEIRKGWFQDTLPSARSEMAVSRSCASTATGTSRRRRASRTCTTTSSAAAS